jgi:polyisoprenyl-teichoic acid--peptidoglycan teichoic acid transferase
MSQSRAVPMQKGYPQKTYPNPYQNPQQRPRQKARFRPFHALKRLIYWFLIAFVVLGTSGAMLTFVVGRSLVATQGLAKLLNLPPIKLPSFLAALPALKVESRPTPVPTPLPWNGKTRVTALVMGLDYRDWEAGDVPRSDSMWLLTVDPVSKTGGMMSIPRDMWVDIPGFGPAKINMAYFYGEAYKTEGGGPALAAKTVENFLDVKINYTLVIDFTSFVKFIDKLDGIYIDVPEEITVDPLGPGNTVTLQPGRQKVFGDVALAYARMRYTNDGDFDRMKRQMQVILAVRDRVFDPKYLPVLIAKAPEINDLVSSGVRTNLNLQEAIQLAWLAKDVSPDRIKNAVIDHNMVVDTYSAEGWAILVPDMTQIRALRDTIFTAVPDAPAGEADTSVDAANQQNATPAPPQEPAAGDWHTEGATVIVQNGTETVGLARRTTDYLASLGLSMGEPSDADGIYEGTTIIDYTGKSATVDAIASVMHVDSGRILTRSDANPPADIVVIAGNDWVNDNPMP